MKTYIYTNDVFKHTWTEEPMRVFPSYAKDREDLPDWFKEFAAHIGDKYENCRGKEITLIGMSETNEDYYFVTRDSNGKKSYESCVGNLDPLE